MQPTSPNRTRGVLALFGIIILTVVVWGVVLPTASSSPEIQRSLQNLEEHGLSPDAMFWSEHPRAFR